MVQDPAALVLVVAQVVLGLADKATDVSDKNNLIATNNQVLDAKVGLQVITNK